MKKKSSYFVVAKMRVTDADGLTRIFTAMMSNDHLLRLANVMAEQDATMMELMGGLVGITLLPEEMTDEAVPDQVKGGNGGVVSDAG